MRLFLLCGQIQVGQHFGVVVASLPRKYENHHRQQLELFQMIDEAAPQRFFLLFVQEFDVLVAARFNGGSGFYVPKNQFLTIFNSVISCTSPPFVDPSFRVQK